MTIYKLTEITAELTLKGYWDDSDLTIDRLLIENHKCPKCKCRLVYKGFSNPVEYIAFGVCRSCDYARKFWTEKSVLRQAKSNLSKRKMRKTEKAVN
ncbi:MAG: hypothetical protein JWM96_1331 [Alphaproteobacteria bacterium]|nr:hypothetical protein [Alphaproteobacteria bacterium]